MVEAQVMVRVRDHFRPEFLNRLDEIVLFRRLQRADMATIVTIQLHHLEGLLADRNIKSRWISPPEIGWLRQGTIRFTVQGR